MCVWTRPGCLPFLSIVKLKQTRITVYDVPGWLARGMTNEEILAEYPELATPRIQACLAYAADCERHSLRITAT
ncbi:MAG: DUF433 domain-containing protein [Proteobacteria bacterium]|jgi:uncharacterized protein (DUF433 family)|nr:DUF433 domain-containing protein [Pseudomonadota bacterium]MDA1298570.1 DUF433 domain-containing protein [Pseudomonadota bacterium]